MTERAACHETYVPLHTHTQPFYGSVEFVRENPGEPVPEETFTHYTHTHICATIQVKINTTEKLAN